MNLSERSLILRRALGVKVSAAILGLTPAEIAGAAVNPAAPLSAPQVRLKDTPGEQLTASASYVLLGDEVTDVDAPNGLIEVVFRALWKRTQANSVMYAALFVDGVQIKGGPSGGGAPVASELNWQWSGTFWTVVTTEGNSGLWSSTTPSSDQQLEDTAPSLVGVSTAGSPTLLRVSPGKHKISVAFKVSAGELHVKQRKLWAAGV